MGIGCETSIIAPPRVATAAEGGDSRTRQVYFAPSTHTWRFGEAMPDRFNTPWRELATALYGQPSEGKIYGTMDLDLTETLAFMRDYRATTGVPLTITHVMTAILGRVLAHDVPELNCFVRTSPRQSRSARSKSVLSCAMVRWLRGRSFPSPARSTIVSSTGHRRGSWRMACAA